MKKKYDETISVKYDVGDGYCIEDMVTRRSPYVYHDCSLYHENCESRMFAFGLLWEEMVSQDELVDLIDVNIGYYKKMYAEKYLRNSADTW